MLWGAVSTSGLAVVVALLPVNVEEEDTHTFAHAKHARRYTIRVGTKADRAGALDRGARCGWCATRTCQFKVFIGFVFYLLLNVLLVFQ